MSAVRKTVVLTVCAAALATAGCGGDGAATATEPGAAGGADQRGRQLFVSNCGACHTLEAAGTAGAVEPPLDDTRLDAAAIARLIEVGAGSMPAGLLEGRDRTLVAEYVAAQTVGTPR